MGQDTLFALILALSGIFTSRLLMRLAPPFSELPLKTILATALCLGVAGAFYTNVQVAATLRTLTLLVGVLYILGPFVLIALGRAGRYGFADSLAKGLYWTAVGRESIRRLLAQTALQRADADAALNFASDGDNSDLLRIQAYALQERWHELLEQPVPKGGDNSLLALGARAQALLALGRYDEAEGELEQLRALWERSGQGALGYRSIVLTEARFAAARGDFAGTQAKLTEPLSGVAPYVPVAILAQAAEEAMMTGVAVQLYTQAYVLAPSAQRQRFAAKLERYGQPLPEVTVQRPLVTLVLMLVIIAAYGVQLAVNDAFGRPDAGALAAGFIVNFAVPGGEALWRYLSYSFVHGNLLHIAMNSWVLFDVGRLYEARRHPGNLLAAFTVGTIMGAYLTVVAQGNDQVLLVGASGGVLGIAGALLADVWRGSSPQDRLLTRALVQWVVIIILFSVAVPNVSLWGHVGGLVGGLLWGFVRQGLPPSPRVDWGAGVVSVGLLLYALVQVGLWLGRYGTLLRP